MVVVLSLIASLWIESMKTGGLRQCPTSVRRRKAAVNRKPCTGLNAAERTCYKCENCGGTECVADSYLLAAAILHGGKHRGRLWEGGRPFDFSPIFCSSRIT